MKKPIHKRIIGGLTAVLLVATIGAVLVNAQTDDTNKENSIDAPYFEQRSSQCGEPPFMGELTVEQRQEIDAITAGLQEEGATSIEIREAVQEKLQEFGIEVPTLDELLDNTIERTEQRLEILNRKKELRGEGYSWEDISDIIQEEFDLEEYAFEPRFGQGQGMRCRSGFRHRLEDKEGNEPTTDESAEL
jgi:hypothetical protein